MTEAEEHQATPKKRTKLKQTFHNHKWLFIGLIGLFSIVFILLATNYLIIGSYDKYEIKPENIGQNSGLVGVVLGGGIENGKPRPLLKDRLDKAIELLKQKKVRKLLLSGDNRFVDYNEPEAMKDYLLGKGVSPSQIAVDDAGRSTYETCERSKKIFGLDKAFFISESTHLPRVLYLCRHFGIEAYGVSSDGQSSAGLKLGQRWREILARTKAGINVYIVGENTVLGPKIQI